MRESSLPHPNRAVYYPHVEFASTAWVKNALLFWEGLIRARPPQSIPHDDPEIRELIDAGLIEEVAPAPVRGQLMPQLVHRLEDLIRCRGRQFPRGIPGVQRIRGLPPELEERDRAEVLESLRDCPLAVEAFRETPDQVRALLFALAAETVAHELRFAPVTDDPTFAAISEYFSHDDVTDDPGRAGSTDWAAISVLCLPAPSLDAIAQISVDRLVELRKVYAGQRRHFRQTLQARVAQIEQLQTRDAVEEHLKDLREEIRDDLEAARAAVRGAKLKERWSLLAVGTPMSISMGMAALSGGPPALATIEGIGALAVGVTRWFAQKRLTAAGAGSPYLLLVDTALVRPWEGLGRALKGLVHA
jgi:hypothetical protein